MQTVLLDFHARVKEINEYFLFLNGLINETIKLSVSDDGDEQTIKTIDSELAKTLKANSFLLLYNLIESSMRNAIEAIFDELKSKKVSFDCVRTEIRKVVLQNFKNRSPDDIHTRITDISLDIITAGFKSKELFSGNIDREEITKTAKKYGFSYDTDYSKTKHGENLNNIMRNRNDLAHGNKSFSEVGKDLSIEDLVKVKNEVVEYIGQILRNIEIYLTKKEYLDSSFPVTP
jgi:MAE_28990/MAE_18760-like HEPN